MDVISICPLRVASLVWQPRAGAWAQTVVCKATYQLQPLVSPLADVQEAPSEEDNHWDDDESRSLYAPCDLSPFKRRPEVLLVGHAFAPGGQPVHSLLARLQVGEIDKSIEVWCDRVLSQDGQVLEGRRFTKMPLRWERAAGGPETSNPVGMRFDGLGGVAIPNLQPPGRHVARRGDTFEPIGFGPVAPSWPGRVQKLYAHAAGWSHRRWWERALPEGIDGGYFNAAPPDQQVEDIRADERIVLENLLVGHPRLVTNLTPVRPRAVAERANGVREEVRLRCDTLWIDTDRGVCTLVWRGMVSLALPQETGRIVVWIDAPRVEAEAEDDVVETLLAPLRGTETKPVLPFGRPGTEAARAPDDMGPGVSAGAGGARAGWQVDETATAPLMTESLKALPFQEPSATTGDATVAPSHHEVPSPALASLDPTTTLAPSRLMLSSPVLPFSGTGGTTSAREDEHARPGVAPPPSELRLSAPASAFTLESGEPAPLFALENVLFASGAQPDTDAELARVRLIQRAIWSGGRPTREILAEHGLTEVEWRAMKRALARSASA